MKTLIELVADLWGNKRAGFVAQQYRDAFDGKDLLEQDLAIFCNAAAHIEGGNEFGRGVEEGKRRVWLHIARMRGLHYRDFVSIADGAKTQHDS